MKIDLHVHTTASDGSLSPAEVVARARAAGLDVIAVADHDTAAGVPEALAAASAGAAGAGNVPRVVPALEISARHRGRDLHVLGYFIDPTHPSILEYGARAREARERRILAMIERLADLDVDVPFEAVLKEAGPGAYALARPHLARAMLAAGHVPSIAAAFDRFLGDEGPAYVATDLLDVEGAIALIHEAGGIAVWAHPPLPLVGDALSRFVAEGLDGLECHRPRLPSQDLNRLLNKAKHHGLLVTGGSDWHGDWHGELGTFHVGYREVGAFLERGGIDAPDGG